VAKELSKSRQLIARWSARHTWVDRARAFDNEVDRVWRMELDHARRQAAQEHAAVAATMIARLGEALAAYSTADLARLSAGDLARWLETATKVQRLALGETTDSSSLIHSVPLEHDPGRHTRAMLGNPGAMARVFADLDRLAEAEGIDS
jgi:hypothetical protein